MTDDSNNSIDRLIKVANQLLKRFEEQKGIIHACLLYTSDAADE